MMKRLIVCLAILVVASTAFGKSLIIVPPVAGDNVTIGYALSSNGLYLSGLSRNTAIASTLPGYQQSIVYSFAGGTVPRYVAAPPDSANYFGGIDIDSSGNMYNAMMRYSGGYVGYFTKNATLSTKTEGLLLDAGGLGSNVTVTSEGNAVAVTPGGDAWLVSRNDGKVAGKAYMYKWDGDFVQNTTLIPSSGSGNVNMGSISKTSAYTWTSYANVPLVVGGDRLGTGGADRPMWSHVKPPGGTSTTKAIPYIAGANIVKGIGYGISSDGMWMSGYMYKWSAVRLMGFRYNWNATGTTAPSGNAQELWPVNSDGTYDSLVNRQALAFDVATDGMAVGYTWDLAPFVPAAYLGGAKTYVAAQSYAAAIWLPGSSQGQLLQNWLNANGVNTSMWWHLVRAEAIEKRQGTSVAKYYITGYGYTNDGQLRAFYIAVPEPATMAFLALGGLAMLRRRH